MALARVNLVHVVANTIPRIAQSRTAVIRFGVVKSFATPLVTVTIGGNDIVCQRVTKYTPVANDVVLVLVDGDAWVVVDKVAT